MSIIRPVPPRTPTYLSRIEIRLIAHRDIVYDSNGNPSLGPVDIRSRWGYIALDQNYDEVLNETESDVFQYLTAQEKITLRNIMLKMRDLVLRNFPQQPASTG